MSRKRRRIKPPDQRRSEEQSKSKPGRENLEQEQPPPAQGAGRVAPDAPATDKQRALLRLACQKGWLDPNPFEENSQKWKNLTAGEADRFLASIPPERLGLLERELQGREKSMFDGKGISRSIGRGAEELTRQIGQGIEGGIS